MKKVLSVALSVLLMVFLCVPAFASDTKPKPHSDFEGKVNIGAIGLYVNIKGSANRDKGEPAVVFESGRDQDHTVWKAVQDSISQKTQTVSYDRADLGQSDSSNVEYSANNQAEQLHALLKKSHVKAPYVLVTHSYGSAITRVFVDKYSEEVAGVVLVDAAHEDQEKEITDKYLDPENAKAFKAGWIHEGGYPAIVKTLAEMAAVKSNDSLRDIPLEIVTADDHRLGPDVEAKWQALQKSFLGLSDYSHQTIVSSYHYIAQDHPEFVITAINAIIQ
ncbi:alpha/beta hydrolase [Paenibacillus sp. SYP-B3998]|uniref:Alpha/beta hydrolase n=1 Tax=Paenibacillus sp. SYP-B3998 TaxID=2678564 RepID=A0A6G3ZZT7_9BACL|nr:alpha/beta hydrolase [Paenibacillus sp. SYP-B3998]NEW07625.1 alpha/beta hydrolase [Paenibacillus sp. SYP-B3998]